MSPVKQELKRPEPRGSLCSSCDMREHTEWCTLAAEELYFLDHAKTSNIYQPGQMVFYQGNRCVGLYCVKDGVVAVKKSDPNGNSVILRLAGAGETLGYRSYFGSGVYGASAEAMTLARVCFIERDAVAELVKRDPGIAHRFLRRLAGDLADSDQEQLNRSTLSVRSRLVYLLLSWRERFADVDACGDIVVELPMSRQDIARMLGTRPETVARTIRSLEHDGVVSFRGRQAVIPDLDPLLDELEDLI